MLTALHKNNNYTHYALFRMHSKGDVVRCMELLDKKYPEAFHHSILEPDNTVSNSRQLGDRILVVFYTDSHTRHEIYFHGVIIAKWVKTKIPVARAVCLILKDLAHLLALEAKIDARSLRRKVAIAMGLHPRLGPQSALGLLSADLVAHITTMIS